PLKKTQAVPQAYVDGKLDSLREVKRFQNFCCTRARKKHILPLRRIGRQAGPLRHWACSKRDRAATAKRGATLASLTSCPETALSLSYLRSCHYLSVAKSFMSAAHGWVA